MIFRLHFTSCYGIKINEYCQQKEQKTFHFLAPLITLCTPLIPNSVQSSIPAVAGPSGSSRSGNR
ncbi:hypothetical protein DOW39_18605 [Salmonella enterica subsp. enterica serovar Tanger]|nr:hypothetical protein [Salmonella enterica subsp. enterica serovar Tanger]EBV4603608.1 hypothetical protein [Salmonella enterica subsp. enterica serovar Tanger]